MNGRLERTKATLRSNPEVCSLSDFYGNYLSNARNDVGTLKRRGWVIESRWTAHGDTSAHCHYSLLFDGERKEQRPTQMSWVAA